MSLISIEGTAMTIDFNPQDAATLDQKDYYTALYRAALTISSSLELEEVLHSVAKSTTEAMHVKACLLRLLDRRTGLLHLGAVYGLSEGYLRKGSVDLARSPIDTEAVKGKPVAIPDLSRDDRFQYQEAARKEGIASVLCVPMDVRGESIGVMRVYADQPTNFTENDIRFLSVLASLSALAIENARLYDNLKRSYDGVIDALWGISTNDPK